MRRTWTSPKRNKLQIRSLLPRARELNRPRGSPSVVVRDARDSRPLHDPPPRATQLRRDAFRMHLRVAGGDATVDKQHYPISRRIYGSDGIFHDRTSCRLRARADATDTRRTRSSPRELPIEEPAKGRLDNALLASVFFPCFLLPTPLKYPSEICGGCNRLNAL